ncbi:MAG: hypothetical protein HY645_06940 [Acidobacteria bacterium]|nr:hypothetical protein [Acidobacteriota bacterium]
MRGKRTVGLRVVVLVVIGIVPVRSLLAHCDTRNGPVVQDAKAALQKKDLTPVLKWIKVENEAEVRGVFEKTLAVRDQGAAAQELADEYFFETVVRLHRAGEGAPYTGLKNEPAEPIVTLADAALATGSVEHMGGELAGALRSALRERFEKVVEARKSQEKSVEAGRSFVEAYVSYMHYVEGIHAAISSAGSHHGEASHQGP